MLVSCMIFPDVEHATKERLIRSALTKITSIYASNSFSFKNKGFLFLSFFGLPDVQLLQSFPSKGNKMEDVCLCVCVIVCWGARGGIIGS